MDDLQFCLMHYQIKVVPDARIDVERPWLKRLLWCPWRKYDTRYVSPMADGAIKFIHNQRIMLMNIRTAKTLVADREASAKAAKSDTFIA